MEQKMYQLPPKAVIFKIIDQNANSIVDNYTAKSRLNWDQKKNPQKSVSSSPVKTPKLPQIKKFEFETARKVRNRIYLSAPRRRNQTLDKTLRIYLNK